MSTLRQYQDDAGRVVANAKMIFSSSHRHTLVVEGDADLRLLRNWLNDKCARIESVDGRENVKRVWRKAKDIEFPALHCLVDLDFDLVANYSPILDAQFVYVSLGGGYSPDEVECNDLESVLIRSNTFTKVMAQKFSRPGLDGENFQKQVVDLREKLRIAARNIGAFRAADMRYRREYGRSPIGGEFRISDVFFEQSSVTINIDALAKSLLRSSRTTYAAMEEVCEIAHKLLLQFDSGWQLCRGHDLTFMLSGYLTGLLKRNVSAREVEEDLRMACELETLYQTRFGMRLRAIGNDLGKPLLSV